MSQVENINQGLYEARDKLHDLCRRISNLHNDLFGIHTDDVKEQEALIERTKADPAMPPQPEPAAAFERYSDHLNSIHKSINRLQVVLHRLEDQAGTSNRVGSAV